jgi:hypothetical protein
MKLQAIGPGALFTISASSPLSLNFTQHITYFCLNSYNENKE